MGNSSPTRKRCAVYTRKSYEEGLKQDFNSLDAQREACLAYIQGQKSEGWKPIRAHYDDGGYSGGNLDRPEVCQNSAYGFSQKRQHVEHAAGRSTLDELGTSGSS